MSWKLDGPFRHDGGAVWIADLPSELWAETDNNELPYQSSLRLLEDGRELGPAHSVHAGIRAKGDGRYSFWLNVVYFSTSDSGDPNLNGRTYSVERAERYPSPASVVRAITPDAARAQWTPSDRILRCAVVGLGNRGRALAKILAGLDGVETAWLIDASADRAQEAQVQIGSRDTAADVDFTSAVRDPQVDAIFVTLPDHLHRAVAEPAFRAGKHVFLEKPIATTVADAKAILTAWKDSGRVLQLGYVLRSTAFYQAIRNVVRQGRLGAIRVIDFSEQLSAVHGASFMRRWHSDPRKSGGLIVHKSCHDLDLVCWLLDSRPRFVSSLGGSATFRKPAPASFCSQCPVRSSCPYVDTGLHQNRSRAEREDPTAYGLDRCVFGMDNKIVDNQVVAFELESGARGTYHLAMQGPARSERRITLIGDEGRLDGTFEDGSFTIEFVDPRQKPISWSTGRRLGGHGGGDMASVVRFLDAALGRVPPPIISAADALAGLVFAVTAERSRNRHAMLSLREQDFQIGQGSDRPRAEGS